MQLLTTFYRELSPPVIVVWCPGGDGHWWARLNPKWYQDSKYNLSSNFWCEEHQEEKEAFRNARLREAAVERARAYGALPLPITKKCANPNPTKHPKDAVLPSGKFYRRHASGVNKGKYILDSRCKACRIDEVRKREEKWTPEQRKADRERRNESARRRREEGHKAKKKDNDKRLPSEPLRKHLKKVLSESFNQTDLARAAKIDEGMIRHVLSGNRKTIRTSSVDAIGRGLNDPGLLERLYPVDQQEAA